MSSENTIFGMNINESLGSGLPFLKRKNGQEGLPLARRMSRNTRAHAVAFLGELVGTFLFLFFSFAGVANSGATNSADPVTNSLYISISFGFALLVNAWTFFRVSGGLFNPAVTWGMCLIGALSWGRGLLVFIAQLLGAILAGAFIKGLYPGNIDVRTTIGEGTNIPQALFIETVMTLQLVLVIFLLAAEKHKATFLAPVGIGLALFSGMLASVRYTGASMNPARSFGPCVTYSGFHGYHWIYWVGPWLGSTVAVLIYALIKALEYETANPGQDDTGEEKVIIENSNDENGQPILSPAARVGSDPMSSPRVLSMTSSQSRPEPQYVGTESAYSSAPRVENGSTMIRRT